MRLNTKQNNQLKKMSRLAHKMSHDETLQTKDIETLQLEANKIIKSLSKTNKFFKRLK